MSFSKLSFTNAGRALQAKALLGTPLVFTKIALGSGSLNGRDPATFTSLLESKVSISISKITREGQQVTIEANFSNQDNKTGFYWREVGLFANDPTLGEILYCYGNAGTLAEYIQPSTSSWIEKVITLTAVVGNAQNVTATINSAAYATKKDISAVTMNLTEVSSQLAQTENKKADKVDLETVSQQVTNLATLTEGSTTGDAELIDGRVAADGTINDNIGENIRVIGNGVGLRKGIITLDSLSHLLKKDDYVMENKLSIINQANLNSALRSNLMWIIPYEVKKGSILADAKIYFDTYPATYTVWILRNDGKVYPDNPYYNLTIIGMHTLTVKSIYSKIDWSDIDIPEDCFIGISSPNGIKYKFSTTDGTPIQYLSKELDGSEGINTTFVQLVANNTPNINFACEFKVARKIRKPNSVIFVGNSKWCDYDNIQDAIDNCGDNIDNPVTIIVFPGVYPRFTMGNHTIGTTKRYISIIGINMRYCIIRDDSGDYTKPPAEIRTVGIIKGLSFIATHDDADAWASASSPSYALHMDFGDQDVDIEDCYFESHQQAAVGIGLHSGEHIRFNNCDFYSCAKADGIVSQGAVNYGSLFIHTPTSENPEKPYSFEIVNCRGIAENAAYGASFINHAGLAVDADYTATYINNMFRTKLAGFNDRVAVNLKPSLYSYGNNLPALNYVG